MPASTASPAPRAVTFDDDFSTFVFSPTGSVGWATELPFWGAEHTLPGNHEAEYYVDGTQGNSPFTDADGVLTISATLASTTGGNFLGLPYNSGTITSYKSFSQLYGKFEVRAELPRGAGLWPAFWLMPTNLKGGPELDIFEVLGDRPDTLYATVHSANSQQQLLQALTVADTSASFHTYAVDWGPKQTVFSIDGNVIATATTPSDMNVPMYMILNLAVGGVGSWPGAPNSATAFPAQMKIDEVRVEQTADTIGWTDPTPSQPAPLVLPTIQDVVRPGTAYAYVYTAHFGNGDGGTALGGVGVALLNSAGKVVATGTTDAGGVYTFAGLSAGTYRIQYLTSAAQYVRAGNFADARTGITGSFTLSDGQGYGVPWQLICSSAELAGNVQLSGQGVANVSVDLLDADKTVVETTQTDGAGHFSFWTPAGQYYVRYDAPAGTTLATNGLADATSGLTPLIVLGDDQKFLLVSEQLTGSVAASPSIRSPAASNHTAPLGNPSTTASSGNDVSIYRFFDTKNGTQFLTNSATERSVLGATRPDLIDEGIALSSAHATDAGAVPVFRFFDTQSGIHFYTSDSTEKDNTLSSRPDLLFEGSTFYEHSTAQAGDIPVFRFFNAMNGTHFYTSNSTERASILNGRPDLIPEGVAFYAPSNS